MPRCDTTSIWSFPKGNQAKKGAPNLGYTAQNPSKLLVNGSFQVQAHGFEKPSIIVCTNCWAYGSFPTCIPSSMHRAFINQGIHQTGRTPKGPSCVQSLLCHSQSSTAVQVFSRMSIFVKPAEEKKDIAFMGRSNEFAPSQRVQASHQQA